MSENLSTSDEKVYIKSVADREGFSLSAIHKDRGRLAYEEFSWEEYETLLRQLWEDYLEKGQKPELAGHILTDDGLVTETLHYIAPVSFSGPLGSSLKPNQESFVYWLKSNYPLISERIDKEAFQDLDEELDFILLMNLERKKS